jgi:Cu-processing system permease protein
MELIFKIIRFEFNNILRTKWIIIYTGFFFIVSYLLLSFGSDIGKASISLMNIVLIIIPLVSIIFGTMYIYNSREYIEMMLCQPINRKSLFVGLYLGNTLPLALAFSFGVIASFFLNAKSFDNVNALLTLIFSGIALTFIFTSIAFFISIKFSDKVKGFGIAILLWLVLAVVYDGIILFIIYFFRDYPVEKVVLFITLFNPIDLSRMLFILNFDYSALMGYTGALFQKFFGTSLGEILSFVLLILWIIIPTYFSSRAFLRKDF